MKKTAAIILIIIMVFALCSCEAPTGYESSSQTYTHHTEQTESTDQENSNKKGNGQNITQTGFTKPLPDEYLRQADQQGTINELTYKSKDYTGDMSAISKKAYIYLPYGYDPNDSDKKYDIMYLMHGLGGTAEQAFTEYECAGKNLIDNMIQNDVIKPMIFVSATFTEDDQPQDDLFLSMTEMLSFHRDFIQNLMPAVESSYHTYAQSTSDNDLKASRTHRAFGGFSLGGVATWQEFALDSDYISCFLPMSGPYRWFSGSTDSQSKAVCDTLESVVERHHLDERGYFIYACTGTEDELEPQIDIQLDAMLKRSDVFTPEHLVYYKMKGGKHDMYAALNFIYNALPLFFQ
ncbi:MAG: hypothetical protein PUA82_03025 [Eubacteriales bacterium]|nr:hypothetical protein [Eubacteriales bacterium]